MFKRNHFLMNEAGDAGEDLGGSSVLAGAGSQRYAAPEDKELIDQIGNNPLVIKLLANVGKGLQEDSGANKPQGISPDDVKGLMMGEAYRNANHPDHRAVHARVREFYERQYGTQPIGG